MGGPADAEREGRAAHARAYFYAFDLLSLEGEDLRERPLLERKRRLAKIIPYHYETRLRLLGHVPDRGKDLFRPVCDHDAEGVVAKLSGGRYPSDGNTTSLLKIKNPNYSQAEGRHEFRGQGSDAPGIMGAETPGSGRLLAARRPIVAGA
jgi:ATP-dependent DNA ligase